MSTPARRRLMRDFKRRVFKLVARSCEVVLAVERVARDGEGVKVCPWCANERIVNAGFKKTPLLE